MISPNIKEICLNQEIDTPEKARLLKIGANRVFQSVKEVCDQHRETLTSVLGNVCALKDEQDQGILVDVLDMVAEKRGFKKTFEALLREETLEKYISSMHVPD